MDIQILEERRPMRAGPRKMIRARCSHCGRPLIKDEFVLGYRLMCDNHECSLFREGQRIELKVVKKRTCDTTRPGYQRYLANKRENYHELCNMGFRPQFAKCFQSTKQTERIGKLIQRGVSRDFIMANLQ